MLSMSWPTGLTFLIFLLTYIALGVGKIWRLKLDRASIALLGAIAMLAFGNIDLEQATSSAINFEALAILFSLMVIVSQLYYGGFFGAVATRLTALSAYPCLFLAILMLTAGILSAFLSNNVVALSFTPILTVILLRQGYNPVAFLIGLAMACNIGSTYTTLGNAQNILIAESANVDFSHYLLWAFTPVSMALIAAYIITVKLGKPTFYLSKKIDINTDEEDVIAFDRWRVTKGVATLITIVVLFFSPLPRYLVTLVGAGILLCSQRLESRTVLSRVDWNLLILFASLFVIIGGLNNTDLPEQAIAFIQHQGINTQSPYILSLLAGCLSILINNAAAVILLVNTLPIHGMNAYVLMMANAFAGNFLLIGSITALIVSQSAANFGVKIKFGVFLKYGVLTTLLSYGILFVWIWLTQF